MYDLAIFGGGKESTRLQEEFAETISMLGVNNSEFKIYTDGEYFCRQYNQSHPTSIVIFSDTTEDELEIVERYAGARVPIIPVTRPGETFANFSSRVSEFGGLAISSGSSPNSALVSAVLESLGLLRSQRRVFVSYKRTESREVAIQLHDELSARGFSVFLDTHTLRPGKIFQEGLWHHLCDSDLVIMLDTPDYFRSKWTAEEFGRALASHIFVLRLIWPDHRPDRITEFSESIFLKNADFDNDRLVQRKVEEIVPFVERLRAHSIAARHKELSGKLLAEFLHSGVHFDGVGALRMMMGSLGDGKRLYCYPMIGVPTSNQVHDLWQKAGKDVTPWFVYDHQGIGDEWVEHLAWLDKEIGAAEIVQVSNVSKKLTSR